MTHIWTIYLKNVNNLDKETLEELFEKYHVTDVKNVVKMTLLHFLNSDLIGFPANSIGNLYILGSFPWLFR